MLFITYTSTSSTAPLSMSSIFSTKSSQTACTSASSHTSLSVMSGDRDALNESNPNQIMAHDQQHDSLLSAVGSWAWALDTSPSGLPEFDDDPAFHLLETSSYDTTLPLVRTGLPTDISSWIEAPYTGLGSLRGSEDEGNTSEGQGRAGMLRT